MNQKTKFLTGLMLLLTTLSFAADKYVWQNPADKYLDAYKAYLDAKVPIQPSHVKHFVYFSRDRELIIEHPFLEYEQFCGAQIMYSWKQLEPQKGNYDFSLIKSDYDYLKQHNKKLFVQLQDATFNPDNKGVPAYLLTAEYDGGVIEQVEDGIIDGWIAKRWNSKVQQRFALLLAALGKEFDGKIEGINLQESSIGVTEERDPTFSNEKYVDAVKINMLSMKKAFPNSVKIQYANFMPGEWLPWEDNGYLKSIYMYGEKSGVGLGGPDLMYKRKGQLNHTIAMMHENNFTVPLGIAIQDGNYIGETGSDYTGNMEEANRIVNNHKNIVPTLYEFARDFMGVDYIFWGNQAYYFEKDVLSCFEK